MLKKILLTSSLALLSLLSFACDKPSESEAKTPPKLEKMAKSDLNFRASHSVFGTEEEEIKKTGLIKWVSFDRGVSHAGKENKFIMIKFYTDWCTYCEKLESETFSDKNIADYVNEKFIPISINAESQKMVTFEGKKISEKDLALSYGVSGYPTLVFMKPDGEVVGHVPQFVDVFDFYTIASFVATKSFEKKTIEQYKESLPQKAG